MWIVVLALIIVIGILILNLCYKNECIQDMEYSRETFVKRCEEDKMMMLLEIKELADFRKTYSKEAVRDYCNKKIAEIAQKNRTEDAESTSSIQKNT